MILLDSSVLIEMFRSRNKENTFFYELAGENNDLCISVITHFEIFSGSNPTQDFFWKDFFESVKIFNFDIICSQQAANIYKTLRKENKIIDISDIFIASTSLANNIPLATLNKNHFERIDGLKIITK